MGLAGSKSAGGRRFADRKDSTMARQRLIQRHNQSAGLLRHRREELNLSVGDVADMMMCSKSTVQRIERDGIQSTTRFNRLIGLSMVYRLSPDEIIDAALLEA